MLLTIAQYVHFRDDVAFLLVKKDYLTNPLWKSCFYIHVFSSILTLIAGFSQFSTYVLRYYKKLHKIVGKIYAYDIFFVNFPSGMVLALYANGMIQSKIAFVILDTLWFVFTYKAVLAIKHKDITTHRKFMIRSYALTLSAITLRLWKLVLSHTTSIDPQILYMMDAWLGFLPNLVVAEWIIRRKK